MSIDDSTIREQARNIILDHAKDIEYLSIGEMIADFDEFSSLPEDEFDRVQGRIDKQIRNATVTVSWTDEQQPDPVSGEQQDGAAGRLRHLAEVWAEVFPGAVDGVYFFGEGGPEFRLADLLTVLAMLDDNGVPTPRPEES